MVMIEITPDELISFLAGAISLLAGFIGYAKKKNVKLLPRELEGLEVELRLNAAGGQGADQFKENLKSVSIGLDDIPLDELVSIILDAKTLSAGGYTQGEVIQLGSRILQVVCPPGTSTGQAPIQTPETKTQK